MRMTIEDVIHRIGEIGIVPVVRAATVEDATSAVQAICAGGIPILEITMTVPNAASVIRKVTGVDVGNYDIHVNVIGGGLIDGPSAGLAVVVAMLSAVQRQTVRQDVAMTGEVSIQGKIKQVGGIPEKIYGARQAGMRKVIIPAENKTDVPSDVKGNSVVLASTIEEVIPHVLGQPQKRPTPAS